MTATTDTTKEQPEAKPGFGERTKQIRTPENRAKILELFSEGKTWPEVSEITGISEKAIRGWFAFDATFQDDYLEAKARDVDFRLDEIDALGNEAMVVRTYPDWVYNQDGTVAMDGDGQPIPHPKAGEPLPTERDKAQRIRAAMEAKKLALEKRSPKKYGNLLKLADAEGEPLKLFVTDYSKLMGPDDQPIDGGELSAETLEAISTPMIHDANSGSYVHPDELGDDDGPGSEEA